MATKRAAKPPQHWYELPESAKVIITDFIRPIKEQCNSSDIPCTVQDGTLNQCEDFNVTVHV